MALEAGSPNDWLTHAESDLRVARTAPSPGVLLETLCFHAQQAAEKALKAVLLAYGMPVPRTHNLRTLIDALPEEVNLPAELDDVVRLTDYAVMTRYPGNYEPVEEGEYATAVHLGESAVRWCREIVETAPA